MNDEQQPACGGRPLCHRHEGTHSVEVDLDEVVEVEDERPVDMGDTGDLSSSKVGVERSSVPINDSRSTPFLRSPRTAKWTCGASTDVCTRSPRSDRFVPSWARCWCSDRRLGLAIGGRVLEPPRSHASTGLPFWMDGPAHRCDRNLSEHRPSSPIR
jgi:hypothetical protein